MIDDLEAKALAKLFHETYERLAPQFGYETSLETRVFDPSSANGQLMIATCKEVLTRFDYYELPYWEFE